MEGLIRNLKIGAAVTLFVGCCLWSWNRATRPVDPCLFYGPTCSSEVFSQTTDSVTVDRVGQGGGGGVSFTSSGGNFAGNIGSLANQVPTSSTTPCIVSSANGALYYDTSKATLMVCVSGQWNTIVNPGPLPAAGGADQP